eukprot:7376043-Prymnesium_polylepis.1
MAVDRPRHAPHILTHAGTPREAVNYAAGAPAMGLAAARLALASHSAYACGPLGTSVSASFTTRLPSASRITSHGIPETWYLALSASMRLSPCGNASHGISLK